MNMRERESIGNLIKSYLDAQGTAIGEITARDVVHFGNIDGGPVESAKITRILMKEYGRTNHISFIEGYKVVGTGKKRISYTNPSRTISRPGTVRTFRVIKTE